MARISGPSDLSMPFVIVGAGERDQVELFLPVDLPEGGQLQLVVGESPLAPPALRADLPRGCMVGIMAPSMVNKHLPALQREDSIKGKALVQLPDMAVYGLPLKAIHWLPEGGFINVRVGPNADTLPTPSTPLAKGTLLFVLEPEPSEMFRQGLRKAEKQQRGMNPFAVTPNGVPK